MLVVRPVRERDHAELLKVAELAGIGMTSLPQDAGVLENKIHRAVISFQGKPEYPQGESFLFALEDTATGRIIGTTGIIAHVGLRRPFYSYKLSTIVQASRDLGIYSKQRVLHMVNDYTGATEIGSLFLAAEYRRDGIGKFLSRCRYLMLAEFPDIFDDRVISEIRGVQDDTKNSPFYNNLARHFFQMEFREADFIHATKGGQFIADLMPKYPIYVNLLDDAAQAVIGQPLAASKPAKQLLEREGFTHQGYIDVFDAGPTMQADRASIYSVAASRKKPVLMMDDVVGENHIVANTSIENFRAVFTPIREQENGVILSAEAAESLQVQAGDMVRYVG